MVFSETTNNTGLIQDCEIRLFNSDFGAISGNTKRLQTFTNLINRALDRVTYELLTSSNLWQWDSSNRTDFPEGTTDLISGQEDYTLDVSHLAIREVQILNQAQQWIKLIPIDEADIQNPSTSIEELYAVDGTPRYFDLVGSSLILYPAPNYNMRSVEEGQSGLKVKTLRAHDYFVYTDTTKTPGFASIFHPLVSAYACALYAVVNLHKNASDAVTLCEEEIKRLVKFESTRQRNRESKVLPKYRTSK